MSETYGVPNNSSLRSSSLGLPVYTKRISSQVYCYHNDRGFLRVSVSVKDTITEELISSDRSQFDSGTLENMIVKRETMTTDTARLLLLQSIRETCSLAHTMNQEVFNLLDVKAKHIICHCHTEQNLNFLIVCSQQDGLMIGRETRNTEK